MILNDKERAVELEKIEAMTHREMAAIWRFAKIGESPYFYDAELYTAFKARFDLLGGMTPEVSKQIGWEFP